MRQPPLQPPQPQPAPVPRLHASNPPSDPFLILRIPYTASRTDVSRAYADEMCKIDSSIEDDSYNAAHQRLMDIGNAKEVLECRRLTSQLMDCINIAHYRFPPGARRPTAHEILGVREHEHATKIQAAHAERVAEWEGYERVAGVVFYILGQAQEKLLTQWRQRMRERSEARRARKEDHRRSATPSELEKRMLNGSAQTAPPTPSSLPPKSEKEEEQESRP